MPSPPSSLSPPKISPVPFDKQLAFEQKMKEQRDKELKQLKLKSIVSKSPILKASPSLSPSPPKLLPVSLDKQLAFEQKMKEQRDKELEQLKLKKIASASPILKSPESQSVPLVTPAPLVASITPPPAPEAKPSKSPSIKVKTNISPEMQKRIEEIQKNASKHS